MIGRASLPVLATLLFAAIGTATAQAPARPSASTLPDGPIPILIEPPSSLDAFLAKLRDPDFVVLSGDHYRALTERAGKPGAAGPEPRVTRVTVRGRADRRTADLEVEFLIASTGPGPAWVPLRLDGLVLASLREGGQTLPLRPTVAGGWEAEVSGPGEHNVRASFQAPVASGGEDRRIDFAIPLAGTTRLDIAFSEATAEATLGATEPLALSRGPLKDGARVDVSILPRPRIDVRWRVPVENASGLPPLLVAQSDVLVEVSPDEIVTRTRATIGSARGQARSLVFSFDPGYELTRVDLDGEVNLPVASVTSGPKARVMIPLAEPLRPGGPSHSVALVARRKASSLPRTRIAIEGFSLEDAAVQSGSLAVTQAGPIWVEGVAGRGLQRVDPSNDLPADLRGRPGTVLAYRIAHAPFELTLHVQPDGARLDVRTRTSIVLRPGIAEEETHHDFRATPGRVFEVRFRIPEGVALEPPMPDPAVDSAVVTTEPGDRPGSSTRLLVVRLTTKARESGLFAIDLRARQPWSSGPSQRIGLVEPTAATSQRGRVAIQHAPGIRAELAAPTGPEPREGGFRRVARDAPADAPWLGPSADLDPGSLRLEYEGSPGPIPLEVTTIPSTYRSEVTIEATVGRAGVDYRQSVTLEAIEGTLDDLVLQVPPIVARDWDVEGTQVVRREILSTGRDGTRRYRVEPARRPAREVRFALRYRVPFDVPLVEGRPFESRFAMIRVLPSGSGTVLLTYRGDPDIGLSVDRAGSEATPADLAVRGGDPGSTLLIRPDERSLLPTFRAVAERVYPLPSLIASRCYLRSLRTGDEVRTTAHYRLEGRGSSVLVTLPADARWLQVRVDGVEVADITEVPGTSSRRIAIGERAPGIGVGLTVESASSLGSGHAWEAPTLNVEVETAFWEVIVPDSHALLGLPAGWSDENRWHWRGFVWMRRPCLSSGDLIGWVDGPGAAQTAGVDPLLTARSNVHAYLFRGSRTRGAMAIPVVIVSRTALVAVSSGLVALVGIGCLLTRGRARSVGLAALGVGALAAAACEPDLTIQAAQSGVIGLGLIAIAATLQRATDRRRRAATTRYTEPIGSTATLDPAPAGPASSVIPDGSTAIRPRPGADPIVISRPDDARPFGVGSASETGIRP